MLSKHTKISSENLRWYAAFHTGTGTGQDDAAAADYWERSARLENVNAQYALEKLWLEKWRMQ